MDAAVVIVGAGPAGMCLAHLLHQQGHRALVLERQSRDHVESRVRAGVLEPGTVALLQRLGLGARLGTHGLVHTGVQLAVEGDAFRIDLTAHAEDAGVTIYGQQEVMRDLFEAAHAEHLDVRFEVDDVVLDGIDSKSVRVSWRERGELLVSQCSFVAGCDGFHGVCRGYLTGAAVYEQESADAWLGILADVPPAAQELIYGWHKEGFVLASMRSPTRSRYYIQCPASTDEASWQEDNIWAQVSHRLGPELGAGVIPGPAFETSIARLRSLVTEPMSQGRLFLAGDSAHIVPPTGAKGMNLAIADVELLAAALNDYFRAGDESALKSYSSRALRRVWQAQQFSWWLTRLTHRNFDDSPYAVRLQRAKLDYLRRSQDLQRVFAANYVGALA